MPRNKPTTLKPKLRFPAFRDQPGWDSAKLAEVSEIINDRAGTTDCVPMSITTGVGLVSQEEKFGRTIHGESYKNYYRLQADDFAYNKSATKDFPQGYIAKYEGDEPGAVPNSIFTCFRPDTEKIVPNYLDYLFASNLHGKWLHKFITVGARAHGALAVTDDDLMAMPIPLPPSETRLAEQRVIADCLGSLDDWLAAAGRKLAALRDHKRGLMQQLFPQPGQSQPQQRFPEFRENDRSRMNKLGKVAKVTTGDKDTQNKVEDGAFPFFVRSQNTERIDSYSYDGEAVLTSGDGVGVGENYHYINGKFDFHQRVYCIYEFEKDVSGQYIFYYFSARFKQRVKRMSAKNSVDSVRRAMVTEMPVWLPELAEQQKIAACLTALDTQITAQAAQIESLKTHKHGLMQQLFPNPA